MKFLQVVNWLPVSKFEFYLLGVSNNILQKLFEYFTHRCVLSRNWIVVEILIILKLVPGENTKAVTCES